MPTLGQVLRSPGLDLHVLVEAGGDPAGALGGGQRAHRPDTLPRGRRDRADHGPGHCRLGRRVGRLRRQARRGRGRRAGLRARPDPHAGAARAVRRRAGGRSDGVHGAARGAVRGRNAHRSAARPAAGGAGTARRADRSTTTGPRRDRPRRCPRCAAQARGHRRRQRRCVRSRRNGPAPVRSNAARRRAQHLYVPSSPGCSPTACAPRTPTPVRRAARSCSRSA